MRFASSRCISMQQFCDACICFSCCSLNSQVSMRARPKPAVSPQSPPFLSYLGVSRIDVGDFLSSSLDRKIPRLFLHCERERERARRDLWVIKSTVRPRTCSPRSSPAKPSPRRATPANRFTQPAPKCAGLCIRPSWKRAFETLLRRVWHRRAS